MKIVVNTFKGTRFEIEVEPKDSVSKVKTNIETVLGASAFPAAQQIFIHKGIVLKDETTMEANKISEKSSIAITLTKNKEPVAALPQTQGSAAPAVANDEGLPNTGLLDFLRDDEEYRRLQYLVKANPDLLPGFLEVLARLNSPLLQIVQDNNAEFMRMLNEEPLEPEDELQLPVTAVENEAIERLEAMGFERRVVLEAFFVCNKNEQLAANYLLDHVHES